MIGTLGEAIVHATKVISKHEKIEKTLNLQGEKGVKGVLIYTTHHIYSIHFRKNFYMSFSYEDNGQRKKGLGVAGDKTNLYACLEHGHIPMIVTTEGKLYFYSARDWIDWCEERKNDRNVIRTRADRDDEVDSWIYYNIPLSLMINYEKWVKNDSEY